MTKNIKLNINLINQIQNANNDINNAEQANNKNNLYSNKNILNTNKNINNIYNEDNKIKDHLESYQYSWQIYRKTGIQENQTDWGYCPIPSVKKLVWR